MFILNSDNFYHSAKLPRGIIHGFGTKKSITAKLFDKKNRIMRPKQIHSDKIENIDTTMDCDPCDGLITENSNLVLTVQTGDCVPIIFADKRRKLIGISHQGWRGSLLRLPQKMIAQFRHLKSNIQDIAVAIGPSIGVCCYDIDEAREIKFKMEFPIFFEQILEKRSNKAHLNLLRLTYMQLVESGIDPKNIDYFPFCTTCNGEKFYSNRRNDMASEMVNFVSLT